MIVLLVCLLIWLVGTIITYKMFSPGQFASAFSTTDFVFVCCIWPSILLSVILIFAYLWCFGQSELTDFEDVDTEVDPK